MTVGDYVTLTVFVLGLLINGVVYLLAVRSQLTIISIKQQSMEEDLTQIMAETQNDVKNLAQVIVLQSRHDERITALTQTVVSQGKRIDETARRLNTYIDLKLGPNANIIEDEQV